MKKTLLFVVLTGVACFSQQFNADQGADMSAIDRMNLPMSEPVAGEEVNFGHPFQIAVGETVNLIPSKTGTTLRYHSHDLTHGKHIVTFELQEGSQTSLHAIEMDETCKGKVEAFTDDEGSKGYLIEADGIAKMPGFPTTTTLYPIK